MKEQKETVSFVGTQYIACALSMLMILSSITPVRAEKLPKPSTIRKVLTTKIEVKLPNGVTPAVRVSNISQRAFAAQLQRQMATKVTGEAPAAVVLVNGTPFVPLRAASAGEVVVPEAAAGPEQALAQVEQHLAKLPVEGQNLVQMYSRIKQLLKLDAEEARDKAGELIKQMARTTREIVEKAEQDATEPLLYMKEVKEFLDKIEYLAEWDTTLNRMHVNQESLQNLYREGRKLYDEMFPDSIVKDPDGKSVKRWGKLSFVIGVIVLISSVLSLYQSCTEKDSNKDQDNQ